jgi:hypothetical protein
LQVSSRPPTVRARLRAPIWVQGLAEQPLNVMTGTWYSLRLEKAGRKIRVYVNDTLRLPYAEPARVRRPTRRTQRGEIQVCYRSR